MRRAPSSTPTNAGAIKKITLERVKKIEIINEKIGKDEKKGTKVIIDRVQNQADAKTYIEE